MKDVGAQTKTGGGMAKGEVPYDQAKAQGIFTAYVDGRREAAGPVPRELQDRRRHRGACRRSGPTWLTSRPRPRSSSRIPRRR